MQKSKLLHSLDEVKAVADIVLPYSNDEDEVAKYLNATELT